MNNYGNYWLDQDEIYENQLGGNGSLDSLYENQEALRRNRDVEPLQVDYRESAINIINNDITDDEKGLNKQQRQLQDEGENRQLTGKRYQFKELHHDHYDIIEERPLRRHAWCFLGFFIGVLFTSAGFLSAHFFIIPYVTNITHGDSQVCQDNWRTYNGSCYYFSPNNVSWEEAQETCLSVSSHLADIQNQEENTWLITQMTEIGENIWIGGKGENSTNFKWQYGPDLEPKSLNFTDWAKDQPSVTVGVGTAQQDCVQMWKSRGFKWDNEHCWKTRKFVCKQLGDKKG